MKKLISLATLAVLCLMLTPAQASSETQTYVANGLLAGPRMRRENPPIHVSNNGFFPDPAGDPTSIRLRDQSGNDVSFTVCQELPGAETGNSCGDGDDVDQDFCSTGANQTLSTAFRAGYPIYVFIDVQDPLTDCTGIGSTGTLTLSMV